MSDHCTWHPLLRWILFLPAGILTTCIAQALCRLTQYLNGNGAYWGECFASALELPAFLGGALWMLPLGHRPFVFGFGSLYGILKVILLCFSLGVWSGRSDGWATLLHVIGLVSTYLSVKHFSQEYDRSIE